MVRQGGSGQRGGDAVGFRDGELHQPVGDQKDQLEHRLQEPEPGPRLGEGGDGADGGAAGHPGHHPSGHGERRRRPKSKDFQSCPKKLEPGFVVPAGFLQRSKP